MFRGIPAQMIQAIVSAFATQPSLKAELVKHDAGFEVLLGGGTDSDGRQYSSRFNYGPPWHGRRKKSKKRRCGRWMTRAY